MRAKRPKPHQPLSIDRPLTHVVHMGPNLDRLWKLRPEDLLRRARNAPHKRPEPQDSSEG